MERVFTQKEPYWRLRKNQRLRIYRSAINFAKTPLNLMIDFVDEVLEIMFCAKTVKHIEPGRMEEDSRLAKYRSQIERGVF